MCVQKYVGRVGNMYKIPGLKLQLKDSQHREEETRESFNVEMFQLPSSSEEGNKPLFLSLNVKLHEAPENEMGSEGIRVTLSLSFQSYFVVERLICQNCPIVLTRPPGLESQKTTKDSQNCVTRHRSGRNNRRIYSL